METTNSLYFEHRGKKYAATIKEDISTDPKIILISPNEIDELGHEIKFQLTAGEWSGPERLKNEFPETYESILKAIEISGYI
jgi:hypothetical protein